ncbi:DNA polymerase III subunit delta' [Alcanivorax sp. 1008]|uniref:DNA polymerase III subunit delta' n=1 Tax=Alcanivorax sp. 1008 TaxID=2816853 RepID=UPI001DE6A661|nr:DNA polymerase III subunit delta' [Alcanivorax sp. 1008]MCC1497707.1 DNA polymerase III subunit delta' [Alcanivorax sp. 1008]
MSAGRATVQVPCIWHRDLLAELMQQAVDQRLPHALVLSGPAGIGKQRLARAFLEALLCQQPQGGLACGDCQSCHLVAAGSHPDMALLVPNEEKKSKVIKVDQVRDLVDFFSKTAQYGGRRVALLWPAESMNRNAQNALLKTLEEPGSGAFLLLLCDQPSRLLPTVRSRCQQRQLGVPDQPTAQAWLAEQTGDESQARALLAAAGGAPLKALQLEQVEWFAQRDTLLGQFVAVLEGRTPVSIAAQTLLKHEPLPLLEALHGWLAAALRGQQADDKLAPVMNRLRQRLSDRRLLQLAAEVQRARQLLQSSANPNPALLMERLLLLAVGVDAMAAAF